MVRAVSAVRGILKTMRPHQWVKNGSVLAPLVFAHQMLNFEVAMRALAGFALFCLLASAVYILNDIVDIEADKLHPTKKMRPIPAGIVPLPMAKGVFAGLVITVIVLGGLLSLPFLAATMGYLANNLLYTFRLKKVAYLDVLSIVMGFELRVIAGALAAGVPASWYLLIVIFEFAAFLGLGKRLHELSIAGDGATRAALRSYSPSVITWLMLATGIAGVATYAIYTLDPETIARFGTPYLGITTIFILFGVLRFVWLVRRRSHAESPTDAMLHDLPFLANLGVWASAVMVILYAA